MGIIYYIYRSAVRKKARTALTFLSICMAFLIFGLVMSVQDLFAGKVSVNYGERLIVASKYNLPLPFSYYNKLKSIDGVIPQEVVHCSILYGYYGDPKNRFRQMAVNPESYMALDRKYIDLSKDEYRAWLNDRSGAIINEATAKEYGWEIGDQVPIVSSLIDRKDGRDTWTFTVRGIVKPKRKGLFTWSMLFHSEYFYESSVNHDEVSFFILNIKDPDKAQDVINRIDDEFANSSYPTKTKTAYDVIHKQTSQVGNFALIATLVVSAAFFSMLLVSGNSLAQSVRERIAEIAVLKTLGYSSRDVFRFTILEIVSFFLFGAIAGLAGAWLLAFFQVEFPGLVLSWGILIYGIILSLFFGALVGIPPALKARNVRIIEALRRG